MLAEAEQAAGLPANRRRGSLHAALEELGRIPTIARGTISPEPANEEDAAFFDVPVGTPLLVETRIVLDAAGTPIEQTETRYSPTRYIFDIELR